ncbi:MAG: Acyl carrier protein, partial [uncultured Gemmatimonadaceae bacterium]
ERDRREGKENRRRAPRRGRGQGHAGGVLHRRPRRRQPGHGRAGDGLRGSVRRRDPGRRRREDHHGQGRDRLHREPEGRL